MIEYRASIRKDLKQVDKPQRERILDKLELILSKDPYAGEKMKGKLDGIYKLRIGDYRVMYRFIPGKIEVVRIRRRGHVYD